MKNIRKGKEKKKISPMPQRTDLFHSTILYSNDLEDIHLSTIKILISKEDNDESVREENERKTDPIMRR